MYSCRFLPIFVMLKGVLLNYCKTKWNTDFRWFLNRYLSNWDIL